MISPSRKVPRLSFSDKVNCTSVVDEARAQGSVCPSNTDVPRSRTARMIRWGIRRAVLRRRLRLDCYRQPLRTGVEGRVGVSGAGRFRAFDRQIHHNRVLTAAHNDGFARFVSAGIDLLMWHPGWYENKITRAGFIGEFEAIAPAHAGAASHDVEDGLKFTVVMRSGFRIRLDDDGSCPELRGSGASIGDCGSPRHAGCLWSIDIEVTGADNSDPLMFPVALFPIRVFRIHGFHYAAIVTLIRRW